MRSVFLLLLMVTSSTTACKRSGGEQPNAGEAAEVSPAPQPLPSASASAAAAKEKPKVSVREGGTMMRAPTDDALYVADEDRGVVHVVTLPVDVNQPMFHVKMPGQPAAVLPLGDRVLVTVRSEGAIVPGSDLTADDKEKAAAAASASAGPPPKKPKPGEKVAYVRPKMVPSATGPGLLLVMKPDAEKGLVEAIRAELPEDAWGVAVLPDESTALVTSAWSHKVSAVDLATGKVRFSVDVRREPRAVVVHPSGKWAYVTHLVGTPVTRIDGIDGEAPTVKSIELPASPLRTPFLTKANASLAYSAVLSPDGKRLFVPRHALGATGPQVWMGVSTVDVLLTADDTPLAPVRTDKPMVRTPVQDTNWMLNDENTGGTGPRAAPNPFVQPRAVVYRKTNDTLLVASEGGTSLVELEAGAIDPAMLGGISYELDVGTHGKYGFSESCGAPSGIALSSDEKTAWVFCRTTGTFVAVALEQRGPSPWIKLGEDPLPAEAALGRRLFYTGKDEVSSGGMGCAGCHPDGRDDGHVWHEDSGVGQGPNFFSGPGNTIGWEDDRGKRGGLPRQTPLLAGRLAAEGPYGWHGESPQLAHRISNSFLLHRWGDLPYGHDRPELTERAMALRSFLRLGLVPPPRRPKGLSEQEKKGKEVFERVDTKCAGCHVPEMDYSDRAAYAVYNKLEPLPGFAGGEEQGFKTPSLLFVAGTAPYGHEGRYSSLEQLVDLNDDRMGSTNQLTKEERAALVAFLRTL